MVKYTGKRLVVKRPGVLSKVQMLNLGTFPPFQILKILRRSKFARLSKFTIA